MTYIRPHNKCRSQAKTRSSESGLSVSSANSYHTGALIVPFVRAAFEKRDCLGHLTVAVACD